MKTLNMRAILVLLASLGGAGCAGDHALDFAALEQSAETATIEAKDLPAPNSQTAEAPAPEAGDLLAKARAIAASKGLGGGAGEDEARARAALAPIVGDGALAANGQANGQAAGQASGQPAGDPQAIFQRAAMRFAAQSGGAGDRTNSATSAERMEPNDPREIFRKAQALARERALAESRAFGALAPTPAPASNAQTYFVEAMRLRQQQSALALGALAQ